MVLTVDSNFVERMLNNIRDRQKLSEAYRIVNGSEPGAEVLEKLEELGRLEQCSSGELIRLMRALFREEKGIVFD